MTFDPSKLVAVNYVTATGIPGPVAIAIAKQMAAGTGNVEALRQCGFCSSDAVLLAAAITAAGAR